MTVDQQGAIAVFESLGFRAEALLRNHVRDRDGKAHDLVLLGHDVAEVLRLLLLTTGILVAVAITAWVTARLARWWLRHREAQRSHVYQGDHTRKYRLRPVRDEQRCLACGGNGQVLRAHGAGYFEPRACPECQPARLAG